MYKKIFILINCLIFPCSCLFAELSDALKQKIGRLFIATYYGDMLDQETQDLIHQHHIGNWIFFSKCSTLTSKTEVRLYLSKLSDYCNQSNGYRPLLFIDQEGGRVSHLKGEFKQFPNPGWWQNENEAEQYGRELGAELVAAGFSVNLAPVVDIWDEQTLPHFKQRMFGNASEKVVSMARAMIEGLHQSDSLAVLKHFPGHGGARGDSHWELPVVDKSLSQLMTHDLKPFIELQDEADGILVAHVLIPEVDRHNPASKSRIWQTDILRGILGYRGVIITDSLTMHGALKGDLSNLEGVSKAIAQSAQEAFLAGSDLLLIGPLDGFGFEYNKAISIQVLSLVVQEFWKAVERGEISESRINLSLERIKGFVSHPK